MEGQKHGRILVERTERVLAVVSQGNLVDSFQVNQGPPAKERPEKEEAERSFTRR